MIYFSREILLKFAVHRSLALRISIVNPFPVSIGFEATKMDAKSLNAALRARNTHAFNK